MRKTNGNAKHQQQKNEKKQGAFTKNVYNSIALLFPVESFNFKVLRQELVNKKLKNDNPKFC